MSLEKPKGGLVKGPKCPSGTKVLYLIVMYFIYPEA
jgi:hypothetical protein